MSESRHFLLHKPFGYLSQFRSEDAREARKKKFLGALHDFPAGTMAIGRLDEHSEGLLLLTTDGRVSERIRRKDVEKEYYAQVDGLITEEAVAQLQTGVAIGVDGGIYRTLPCAAFRLPAPPDLPPRTRKIRDDRHGPTSWVSITVTEGKNRQVRKMTAAVGFPTLRLVRVRIGTIGLAGLVAGEVREVAALLTPDVAAVALATEIR
ncbi:pseudouridine synthase [Hymenobacter rubripertinctus]|uniref:Pseudouridine synthase n=1 Tax=Hymenobacter rubripertinctus TaxID=2029981 RepID=A0A418R645_9BACT|nr:pseudouridine synthase [Hymenobacter rubripertinctus]RIY12937.1 pseudouridine synthase [Hymenobacter rubripertinctus]